MREVALHGPVYDLGTSARFAKEMSLVKPIFNGVEYRAGGFEPDMKLPDPCDFHCDVQRLDGIETGSVGAVISLEVLEHVQDPMACVNESFRVLKPGGVCLLTTPFMTGYHGKNKTLGLSEQEAKNDHESYSDYWRFTHEGLLLLFKNAGFTSIKIYPMDGPVTARMKMCKLGALLTLPFFADAIAKLEKPGLGRLTSRHLVFAIRPS